MLKSETFKLCVAWPHTIPFDTSQPLQVTCHQFANKNASTIFNCYQMQIGYN